MGLLSERLAGLSAAKLELLSRRLRQRGAASLVAPPIRRRDASKGRPPLSFAQQRLWFLEQLEPGNVAYNIPLGVRLSGRLDVGLLEKCLGEVERRHETLRTNFADEGGRPVQLVSPPRGVKLTPSDLRGSSFVEREVERHRRGEEQTAFDLTDGPLWRVKLLRLGEEEHVLLLTMHHIISDGWSTGVLAREVAALYGAFSRGLPSPLPELPVQYADYAEWQREWLQGDALEAQLSYWRERLAGAPASLELPTDRPHAGRRTNEGATHSFVVPRRVTSKLAELARAEGATPFMVLLAAFAALLSRYTGQEDVVVGTVVAGRQRAELEGLIGFFVNTLVLRADLSGGPTFRELLERAREVTLGAYAHQDVPFERLVEELRPERDPRHTPFFQAALVFQNVPRIVLDLEGLRLEGMAPAAAAAKFDLTLVAGESGGETAATFAYSADLFDASTIEAMAGRLQQILREAADAPDAEAGSLGTAAVAEAGELIGAFNAELE
jgi:Condensation domain